MAKAFSYIRFSSEKQALGDSLRRQLKKAQEYAVKHDLEIDTLTYRDPALSAYKGKNVKEGALGAFLKAVSDGRVQRGSTLIVESLDRISREKPTAALSLFLDVINSGITIVTLDNENPTVYTDEKINEDGGMQLFGSMMVLIRAHGESKLKGKRVKEAWEQKFKDKEPIKNCPPWLKVSEDGTKYIKISEHVKIVKKIFDLSLKGSGIVLIQNYLTEHNIPYIGKGLDEWSLNSIVRTLHNQAVIGRLVSAKTGNVIEDYYPEIISKETFFEVQEKIAQRNKNGAGRKGEGIANLFSGICKCGDCGNSMRITRASGKKNGKEWKHTYLHCTKSFEKKKHTKETTKKPSQIGELICTAPRLNYEHIEKKLLKEFITFGRLEIRNESSIADPAVMIRAEIADKEAVINSIMDSIEMNKKGENRSLGLRLSLREKELSELTTKLMNSVPPKVDQSQIDEALKVFLEHKALQGSPGPELNETRLKLQSIIRQFIERIELPSKIKAHPRCSKLQVREAMYKTYPKWQLHLWRQRDPEFFAEIPDFAEFERHYNETEWPLRSVLYTVPLKGFAIGNMANVDINASRALDAKSKKAPKVS